MAAPGWARGVNLWRVSLSYRGPLISAVSCSGGLSHGEDISTNPKLVALCISMAAELGLSYLDVHELRACVISWDEMTEEACERLDYSDMPNAFSLLFYE